VSVLTLGETMALLDPVEDGELGAGTRFELRVAGAESNFGIALVRLGVPVTWVSRLGADPLGDLVADTLAAEGLDLRYVRRDPARPTGVYFKQRVDGRTSVFYYRAGSAASALEPGDVPDDAFDGVRLVHLTGITTALGDGPRALVVDVARRARERGCVVLFDPNFRPALWPDGAAAADAQRTVLPFVDWYLCGLDEGRALWGADTAEELAAAVGTRVVARIGERGALVVDGGAPVEVAPEALEAVRDEIGAGDGFAAGFAFGLLNGWATHECAHAGNRIAAAALRGTGDWETFPRDLRCSAR
jgi:2-dehydro-3-deoxygluconokinase